MLNNPDGENPYAIFWSMLAVYEKVKNKIELNFQKVNRSYLKRKGTRIPTGKYIK